MTHDPFNTRAYGSLQDLTHRLVAQWLQKQGYSDTLAHLSSESEVPIPRLLNDKRYTLDPLLTDLIEDHLHRLAAQTANQAEAIPFKAELAQLVGSIPKLQLPNRLTTPIRDLANFLTVQVGLWPRRRWDSDTLSFKRYYDAHFHSWSFPKPASYAYVVSLNSNSEWIPSIYTTSVDSLKIFNRFDASLLDTIPLPSPIISFALHRRIGLFSTMQGSTHLIDLVTRKVKQVLRDHTKYVVGTLFDSDQGKWAMTWARDNSLRIYEFEYKQGETEEIVLEGEESDEFASEPEVRLIERHVVHTVTNPEAAVFLPGATHLVYTARDDHLLHEVVLPQTEDESNAWSTNGINLNENGDDCLQIALHPTLPILSLQTSTENARILLYAFHSPHRLATLHTQAIQTDYFQPKHVWLPSGNAVVVTSEDGILRIVGIGGRLIKEVAAHGAAVPDEEEDGLELSERAHVRRVKVKGSSVIKGVTCVEDEDGLSIWSCGFDKTVKRIH
ncbi:BQ5605_C034g11265 [Microbotryum silenes-dioicae]|uniref:BQ5605_C034g11265 protein n=1 Tax=Microbotryum silenes-dioicae TaxID=796604 RepID=A0A2X0N9J0_9BASI|nr:BQ5605_C034g11265 [Microbotryum silenes-dioicae]